MILARAAMLLLVMMLTATTVWATDVTLSGSGNYTAQNGDVLTGSTSGTVTVADNAGITLSGATIGGGIVCAGSATITLVGTNSVSGATYKAGIEVGGTGTTLTIKGDGSLTATGSYQAAGIGLSRSGKGDAIGGNIVIEGGNVTATGGYMAAGIGIGTMYTASANGGNPASYTLGSITIKGATVTATGGTDASGIGAGYTYSGATYDIGAITIYNTVTKIDASSFSKAVTYMVGETNVTDNAANYFNIVEDGNRRIITPLTVVTLSASNDYTAQDGDILTGSTNGTVTIADGASITLSDVTINGGIVCAGTATITLVGENSVTGKTDFTDVPLDEFDYYHLYQPFLSSNTAGIQVGGENTTLTIRGDGALTAIGGAFCAGIGLPFGGNR